MVLSTFVSLAGSAILTITEWAGSAVVGEFVTMGFSYLRDRELPANSEAELKRLQTALPQIKDVMGIAEALKEKDPSTSEWVEKFRQAVEASEDVLDELEYKKLEDKVKTRDEAGGSTSSSKKRKVSALNDDTLERLKKALTLLDEAAVEIKHLLQHAKRLGIHDLSESQQETSKVLRSQTTSFLTETKVFGREVEKEKIIGWLKRPTDARLSSFGIVGVGGLGKTTLAQFAYQEMHGSNHFDKTIWVCVSTNFNVEDITRKMLGELGESSLSGKPLNAIQEILKEKTHLKKLLIILDDLWDDEKMSDWEQLVAPLRFVQQGSKILFTTRMKSVADLLKRVIRTEHESLALHVLEEQELRLLFESYAFHGFNLYKHSDLRTIGDQILKMLLGSPLAAKVIGNLLNSCMDNWHWERVLNQGSLFNLKQAKNVVEVLKLSYYHLPANLQVCFRFCSIFPQDHKFDKDDLIKMWICSGFIRQQSSQEERPEDIGEDYFNLLLGKSFFELQSDEGKTWYTMHDLIHELAHNVSYGECCRIEDNNEGSTIPSTVRHVFVQYLSRTTVDEVSHLENLRSLVINDCYDMSSLNNLIKKPLRLLKINVYGDTVKLSEEISCLVHLRYLSIHLNWGSQPFQYSFLDSIYKLYHLQVLAFSTDSQNTSHLRIETTGITNLLCLRYMRLLNKTIEPICEIHKLTSLQELTFRIGKEIGYRIDELRTLNNLRHLSIENIENIGDHTEAKCANLLGKNDLMSLSLKWGIESNPIHHEKTIDLLQPPPRLRELTIENYNGQSCPNWMEDSLTLNLSSLKLLNCPLWKNQLFFGNIPYLRILDIRDCQNLDKLPDMPLSLIEFRIYNVGLTSLPALYQNSDNNTLALRVVEIEMCPNLLSLHGFLQQDNLDFPDIEELTIRGCERLVHMPTHGFGKLTSLKYSKLNIMDCPNLTEFPTLLPLSVTQFCIKNVGLSALPEYYQSSNSSSGPSTSSLKIMEIEMCPNLLSVHGFLQQDNLDFPAIEKLTINGCERLVHLPTHGFGNLTSLKYLKLTNNPKLVAMDFQGYLLPTKLQRLYMGNSGELDLPVLEASYGITTLTELDLGNANIISIVAAENSFRSLKSLKIMDCPNLTEFPTLLPLSITQFYIKNVGLSALPEYYQSPDSSSGPSTSSLRIVLIENCQNLRSLNGFLQQDNIDFLYIEKIKVMSCRNLVHLPMGAFGKFVSLQELTITNCPMLMAVDKQSTLLPMALEHLIIINCGKVDESLLELASSLPTLFYLYIGDCANIYSIPSSENAFRSLNWLHISKCEKLVEHSPKEQAHGADRGSSVASLKIKNLDIDNLSLLLIEPLRSLSFVSHLQVSSCSWMEALLEQWFLQNSSTLKELTLIYVRNLNTLSATMVRLTVLERLEIYGADLLEELPELPASLRKLYIKNASSLKSLPAAMARLTTLESLQILKADLLEKLPELPSSLKEKKIEGRGGRLL